MLKINTFESFENLSIFVLLANPNKLTAVFIHL